MSKIFDSQQNMSTIIHEAQITEPDTASKIRIDGDRILDITHYRQHSIDSNVSDLSVLSVVRSRQKVEEDVSRLHNRVRLLINEEAKALKLI